MGAKVRAREEKNPDHRLRSRNAGSKTARMLAWKQPFIQRVRNSSLVEELGVDNNRVLKLLPKPWDT